MPSKTPSTWTAAEPALVHTCSPEMDRLHRTGIVIEKVQPQLDGGRYPIKRVCGDIIPIQATLFRHGHDLLTAVVKYRPAGRESWSEAPLQCVDPGNDRWAGIFHVAEVATYEYTIEAWVDEFGSWRRNLARWVEAGQDVASELLEGLRLIRQAADRAARSQGGSSGNGVQASTFLERAAARIAAAQQGEAARLAMAEDLAQVMAQHPDRSRSTQLDCPLHVVVDERRARFSAWYEFFPRSQGTSREKGSTFHDCVRRLPDIQQMGFDVVYLPPIHPIGRTNRKGKNNSLTACPGEPGSPWAIGNEHGGHMAIEPSLGTLDEFREFVQAAEQHGIAVALDFAIQCSPDHPYAKEHPEWFYHRPDGTIKYAENPPKKYQDIYPLNFECEAWQTLWEEMKRIVVFWVEHGVKIFRVDNPHTKPVHFWEWLIREVKKEHPEVIFLSEAFTRPAMMKVLAKCGFTQSYTYFTWRNQKQELTEYLTELTQTEMAEYYCGNFFANTPDILHAYLQHGGRPAFKARLLLAATLSSVYGIYSGFEFCENVPLHEGSEEYLDSEKYEIKVRDWDAPGNIKGFISTINRTRRENPALQQYRNLHFHQADNNQILCYSKATPDFANAVLVIVNLDPHRTQEGFVQLDLGHLGLEANQAYQVCDQITGAVWNWRGRHNYFRLDPNHEPGHLLVIRR